jgi:DNA polymerase I-like protein with 3'-5' exonuclease and polymerase domains
MEMFSDKDWAKPLLHYIEVKKLLGQLAEGNKAWLKLVKEDGRLHGRVDTLGTVSGRMTHSDPNMAQIPSPRAYKGKESRQLFICDSDRVLVGCDLSGVELRCLAHYMGRWDNGRYADILLNEDIHVANQKAAGLETRDLAKVFAYATLYGAGDSKLGSIVGGTSKIGKKLREAFEKNTPGYKQLTEAVKSRAKQKGYLIGVTGRRLYVRSPHSALNTLLQSLGAYIAKQWLILVDKKVKERGLDAFQISHVHDEITYDCSPDVAEEVAQIMEESATEAGEMFKLRVRIDAEAKIGKNWFDIH